MAEVRNVFIKSKMNKDLDERLLPPGEYRDGQNISVNKSEGPDEGVVENILGNSLYSSFNFGTNVEIIGTHVDTNTDRIYVFATNHSDGSPNQMDARAIGNVDTASGKFTQSAVCVIAYIEGPTASSGNVSKSDILVSGTFLNFSKTHPILGIDIIEDLLFFTDNRNQPRKINVETAIGNSATSPEPYYTNEDHISVAKICPVDPIRFIYQVGGAYVSGLMDETSEYLPANSTSVLTGSLPGFGQLAFAVGNPQLSTSLNGLVRFKNLNFPELGYFEMKTFDSATVITFEYPIGSGNSANDSAVAANEASKIYKGTEASGFPTVAPFKLNDVLQFERKNPVYDSNYSGDKEYLKNKFIRFSYRFKFDDGEYSLMAPFTQHAFVPKQYGYFLDSAAGDGKLKRNEKDTAESGINRIMENQVTSAKFRIDLPHLSVGSILRSTLAVFKKSFKVESIQILLKESDGLAIKVVDDIKVDASSGFTDVSFDKFFEYNYKSEKPFKVLPEADSTRVHDKVPIRAAAQAVSSNRVIYANFIEKHTSPDFLQYNLGVSDKPSNSSTVYNQKEYPNHTLKQNRSYKVGVVLVDRYGRSSNVILRKPTAGAPGGGVDASIYSAYEDLIGGTLNWPGNNLNILFNQVIPQSKSTEGYPGLWSINNPNGFYSYKVVVQQKQQEYYNVYVPGATSGKITFTGKLGSGSTKGDNPTYTRANTTSNIVLYGDNINKIPKELADVGPTEEIYGSETLLYPRVVTRYIVDSTNSPSYTPVLSSTESSQIRELNEFTVTSIISFNDLGKWTGQNNAVSIGISSYPNDGTDYIDPLYLEASSNPFVAQLSTNFLVGFAPIIQLPNITTPLTSPQFSKNLNVFETNPVISNIDIFWESSTSGLISELNADILGSDDNLIVGITEPNLVMDESITPGVSSWVSDPFEIIDSSGVAVSGSTAVMNVTDNTGSTRNLFELVESPAAPVYKIRYNPTDAGVYYGSNAAERTFNFNITSTDFYGVTNETTHQMLLGNVKPSLIDPLPYSEDSRSSSFTPDIIYLFEGENGSGATSCSSNFGCGSWDYPFNIASASTTAQGPGWELIRLHNGTQNNQGTSITQVFNGSSSTGPGVQQREVSLTNVAGSVNSQRLFIKEIISVGQTNSNKMLVRWSIVDSTSELGALKSTIGDLNTITGQRITGQFLWKVNVVDAGGQGQGSTRVYSSWFKIY